MCVVCGGVKRTEVDREGTVQQMWVVGQWKEMMWNVEVEESGWLGKCRGGRSSCSRKY